MTPHLFSLALASATAWAVLALGYLPVTVLRRHQGEPLIAVASWAVVSVTAPAPVFHWYLIFALICLVAWTRLDRPAGKICLAISGALGLSLGIVFPLEVMPESLARENPLVLASLYLGGAATGLACVLFAISRPAPDAAPQLTGFSRVLVIVTIGWTALLGEMLRLNPGASPRALALPGKDPAHLHLVIAAGTPFGLAIVLLILAFLAFAAARRKNLRATTWFAGVAALLAFVTSLLMQLVFAK